MSEGGLWANELNQFVAKCANVFEMEEFKMAGIKDGQVEDGRIQDECQFSS